MGSFFLGVFSLFFFYGLETVVAGDTVTEIPIPELLKELGEKTASPNDKSCNGALPQCAENDKNLSFQRDRFDKLPKCSEFNSASLCEKVCSQCRERYESQQWTNSSCFEFTDLIREKRFASQALRKKIFSFTARFFDATKNDPKVQRACCGEDEMCKTFFSRTELLVLRGLPKSDQTAHYRFGYSYAASTPDVISAKIDRNVVSVSEAILLNSYNEQGIEQKILHELGHACQVSRHVKEQPASPFWAAFYDGACQVNQFDLFSDDVSSTLGSKTGMCVKNALIQASKTNNDACLNSWVREAFADIVFYSFWQDLAHWAWGCRGVVDTEHGPTSVAMDCAFKNTQFGNSPCSE